MAKLKEQTLGELSEILENHNIEDVLALLSDFLNGSQLEEFLEYVKDELEP